MERAFAVVAILRSVVVRLGGGESVQIILYNNTASYHGVDIIGNVIGNNKNLYEFKFNETTNSWVQTPSFSISKKDALSLYNSGYEPIMVLKPIIDYGRWFCNNTILNFDTESTKQTILERLNELGSKNAANITRIQFTTHEEMTIPIKKPVSENMERVN